MSNDILSREEFCLTVLHQWGAGTAACREKLENHDVAQRAENMRLETQVQYLTAQRNEALEGVEGSRVIVRIAQEERDLIRAELGSVQAQLQNCNLDKLESEITVADLRAELATVKRERDEARTLAEWKHEENGKSLDEAASLRVRLEAAELDSVGSRLALTTCRNMLTALRREAANDELLELCEELAAVLSVIDASLLGTQEPAVKESQEGGNMKPCPFTACGSSAAVFADQQHSGKELVHQVVCSKCGARGPETSSAESAISEWNSRLSASSTSGNQEGR